MKVNIYSVSIFFLLGVTISTTHAERLGLFNQCVLMAMAETNRNLNFENKTVKEVKASCTEYKKINMVNTRRHYEHNKFIRTFKPNYILPYSYNGIGYNSTLYQEHFNDPTLNLDKLEAQFQFSIKVPIVEGLFNREIDMYVAYTNRSFWQIYNDKISAPFRDTNHEPEMWLQQIHSVDIFGFIESTNIIGIAHQSNGRSKLLSRSWNKVYVQYMLEKTDLLLSLKAWIRIVEKASRDDNPDLLEFLGHTELRVKYKHLDHIFSFMTRNNIESRLTKGALELAWSFPIGLRKDLKGYLQAFSGYGESMIDYNYRVTRIGLGVLISDWM